MGCECITNVGAGVMTATGDIEQSKKLELERRIKNVELENLLERITTFSEAYSVLNDLGAQPYIRSENFIAYPAEKETLLFIRYDGDKEVRKTVPGKIPEEVLLQLDGARTGEEIVNVLVANKLIEDEKDMDIVGTKDGQLVEEHNGDKIREDNREDLSDRANRAPEGPDVYSEIRRRERDRERDMEDSFDR